MKARNRNKARKVIRQEEAMERQRGYDLLLKDEKIHRAKRRGGAKELARLLEA